MKLAVVALVIALASVTGSPPPDDEETDVLRSRTVDRDIEVGSDRSGSTTRTPDSTRAPVVSTGPEPRRVRVPACPGNNRAFGYRGNEICEAAYALCRGEPAGSFSMWIFTEVVETRTTEAYWTLTDQRCVQTLDEEPPEPALVLPASQFRRLPLPAGALHLQPAGQPVLINYPMNAYVQAKPLLLRTTVLGVAVEVEATPVTYTWTFGDGGRLVTEDPGGPYPDMTTTHTYGQPGRYRVALSTTYEGRFRRVGTTTWQPVDGTATVPSPPVDVEAIEARAVLVP